MELIEKNIKLVDEVERLVNYTCGLLNDNKRALMAIAPQTALFNEMVFKNFSLYSTAHNDTRAKILRGEIMDYWRNATPFKMVSKTMILEKFLEIWHKLSGSGFHFKIDNILFKIILVSEARGFINETKAIEFCHLDAERGVFTYSRQEIESFVVEKIKKLNAKSKENKDIKTQIEK